MIEQFVKSNCLSCLLNEDRRVELIPEPFRMQGNVSFRVTFREYVNYILALSRDTRIILSTNVNYLKELAHSRNPHLYPYFLKDMAFAISKEVWFAEFYNKDASIILPASLDSKPNNAVDLLQYYIYCGDSERMLLSMVNSLGFDLNIPKRQHNLILFRVAVAIYHTALHSKSPREMNLVYEPNNNKNWC